MDDRNAQVGWTEAQWNRVREEVLQAWQRVRVAGSFLPIYGPLPPSTQVVPSEVLKRDGSVDNEATANLVEIALPVTLSRQQIQEEDLSSALLQFRRRATQLGQLEDWFIFNGTYPSIEFSRGAPAVFAQEKQAGHPHYRPALPYLDDLTPSEWSPISGTPRPIDEVNQSLQKEGMRHRNPGALGLIEGPRVAREEKNARRVEQAKRAERQAGQALAAHAVQPQALQEAQEKVQEAQRVRDEISWLDNSGLMQAIVDAINSLEDNGYVAPYVCVFGRNPFEAAFNAIHNSTVLPRDRIEPLIGRELLHASGIDILPHKFDVYDAKLGQGDWRSRGVLLSMTDEPIDLALAAEATPEFRQVNLDGKYVFSVFERFALRIKDAKAIVPLMFEKSEAAKQREAARQRGGPAGPGGAAGPAGPGGAAGPAGPGGA
jgi:uncharacterized linocin/CFP29 family protein